MSGLVSVIIPVYNAEKWLARCLDAVLKQSYAHLEIWLVNDGSGDGSLALCRAYAAKDARVHIIDQPNGGPGAARNAALSRASGEYVLFVDADDTLLPGAVEALVRGMEGADLAIARYNLWIQNKMAEKGLQSGEARWERQGFLMELLKNPGSFYYSALWNKLYRRGMIERHGLRFEQALTWGEDFDFNMRYYRFVQAVRCIPAVVYDYHWSTGGQTWRTLFELPRNLRIKRHLYRVFRAIYQEEGLYARNRAAIHKYIFNVTLFD